MDRISSIRCFNLDEDFWFMKEINKAKYYEWLMSLTGACLIAFGLGVLLSDKFQSYYPYIILIGIVIHGIGMFKVHQRNKKN